MDESKARRTEGGEEVALRFALCATYFAPVALQIVNNVLLYYLVQIVLAKVPGVPYHTGTRLVALP